MMMKKIWLFPLCLLLLSCGGTELSKKEKQRFEQDKIIWTEKLKTLPLGTDKETVQKWQEQNDYPACYRVKQSPFYYPICDCMLFSIQFDYNEKNQLSHKEIKLRPKSCL